MAKKNLKYPTEKIDELLTKVDEQMATKTDLAKKVDKVDGKGLSTNDYSTAEKNKLATIQEGAQKNKVTSVRGALELYPQVGDVVISAGSIGLGDANTRLTSLENNKLDKSEKGATNGVASLDENGRVPSSQLPSYVDDVIDDYTYAQFPATGETGKIYIAKDTNKTYRWSGNGYAEISSSLALGETEQTAYSGAKGKKNAEDIATLQSTKATKSEAQGYAATAKSEAIAEAAADATAKANKAKEDAIAEAGGLDDKVYDYCDEAIADAIGHLTTDGQVADNAAAIEALEREQNNQGLRIAKIEGSDAGKSARTIAAEEVAKVVADAPEDLDTLKEIATYIASDKTGAAQMNNAIAQNAADIVGLEGNITDLEERVSSNKTNISDLEDSITTVSSSLALQSREIAELDSNKLGKTEKAADSAKADYATSAGSATNATNASQLGGVAASGYALLSGAQFTGLLNASTVFRVNASAAVNKNCIAFRAETVGPSSNQGLAHIGTNYGNSYPGNYEGLQNIIDAIAIYRSVVGIGRSFTFDELSSVYSRGERMYVNGTTNSHIYTSGDVSATGANPTSFFRWGRFDENGGLKMQFGADSGTKWELINKAWNKALFSVDTSGNQTLAGTMNAIATHHISDERLKTFEDDVEVDLEKLKALPKKYFHWTADTDKKRQLGTSAQAVEALFPELVSTNDDGYKSVNYANLSIVALAAVDKLAEQNAELERRLAKIEKLLNIE